MDEEIYYVTDANVCGNKLKLRFKQEPRPYARPADFMACDNPGKHSVKDERTAQDVPGA